MTNVFDVTIIGSGPGGYVCAIRAAQLGLKVAIVEQWPTFGGTCLNIGCIPSKAMLHASEMVEQLAHNFDKLGIEVSGAKVNLDKMMAHKDGVVKANTSGIEYLFKKNKITAFKGLGSIEATGKVKVTPQKGDAEIIETKNIIIATGSVSTDLPGLEIDEKQVVSSTGALSLSKVPQNLLVIGAGVIGLELGSVWARLGAKVTVVEYLDHILPGMDKDLSKNFMRNLKKQGFDIKLSTKVTGVNKSDNGLVVTTEAAQGGSASTIKADIVLVAIGRKAFTSGLGLEKIGVELDERGRIKTNDNYKSSVDGIYAIGDVIKGPMLAHKASEEGVVLAEILAGKKAHVNYGVIPGVVYTSPEIASVGKTEEQLKEEGIAYKVGKFPFSANGRAKAMLASDGFVKILADAKTDRVLGGHILGQSAGEMIHEIAILMEFSGAAEDLALTCHAHPTMSEAIKEAALALGDGALHT